MVGAWCRSWGELALIAIASFLGPHRIYRILFFVVIGKGVLLLNRTSTTIVILLAVVQQLIFVKAIEVPGVRFVPLFPQVAGRNFLTNTEYFIYFSVLLLLVVFVSILLRSEQESRRRAEELKLEMDSVTLTLERERIARDIHDSLGHALTGLNVQLQLAQKLHGIEPAKAGEAIALARGFATRAVADVRRAVRAVRDAYFDFPASVKELVEVIESNGACEVTMNLEPISMPPQLCHNLFFLIQECLTNVQRHAHANSVLLELTCNDQIHLHVKDNGIGFSKVDYVPGFGIMGMQERVASMGGTVAIVSAVGEGTDIDIAIPMTDVHIVSPTTSPVAAARVATTEASPSTGQIALETTVATKDGLDDQSPDS